MLHLLSAVSPHNAAGMGPVMLCSHLTFAFYLNVNVKRKDGFRPILCICFCVSIDTMLNLTLTLTQTSSVNIV